MTSSHLTLILTPEVYEKKKVCYQVSSKLMVKFNTRKINIYKKKYGKQYADCYGHDKKNHQKQTI